MIAEGMEFIYICFGRFLYIFREKYVFQWHNKYVKKGFTVVYRTLQEKRKICRWKIKMCDNASFIFFFNKHRALFYKNSFDRKHISLTILISNVYFLSKNISHKNFKILVQRLSYATSNLSSLALPINKDDKTNKLFYFSFAVSFHLVSQ